MSSRYLKDLDIRRSKIIHIYRNGDPYGRAIFVILRLPEQAALERIVKAIEEKVRLPLNRPIRKLFELTGTLVQSHTQIVDGNYYVAASSENFLDIKYGHPANWVLVGPVRTSKYENVHYVTRAEEEGKLNQLSASNNVLSTSRTNKPVTPSKKSGRKSIQSLKKEDNKKKQNNKKMFASEHVDNILDDRVDINIDTEVNEVKDDERKDKLEITEPQNENKDPYEIMSDVDVSVSNGMPQKSEIEDLVMNKTDDKISLANEATLELQAAESNPIENLSEFQDSTTVNVSNQVFDNTDAYENENVFEETERKFNGHVESKDLEDLEKLNQVEVKEMGDETDRDVNEILPQDSADDNQNNPDTVSDELYSDAATKIQATYRGFRVRNELDKAKKSDFPEDSIDENPDLSEATNYEENI